MLLYGINLKTIVIPHIKLSSHLILLFDVKMKIIIIHVKLSCHVILLYDVKLKMIVKAHIKFSGLIGEKTENEG